jgi:hypothetical protein
MKSARASVISAVIASTAATIHSSVSLNESPWTWCRCEIKSTPATDPGTEPNASHFDRCMSTVPLRQWR